MGKIWRIYSTDWKNIFSVPSVVLLIGALMILPSAYAWINIKSMWDPYGNTSGILVAVANEDEGGEIRGRSFNAGEETVEKLKNNHQLGWRFMNVEEAVRGVEEGKYYAYLIIPTNFSKRLSSIIEKKPQKPEIIFGVNEKINAVAPKMAASGASSVTAQISSAFAETVGKVIFSAFYGAGVRLEQELPSILSVENQIFALEKALPQLQEMGNKAIEIEEKMDEIKEKGEKIIQLEQRLPEIEKAGNSILKLESNLPKVKQAGDKILKLESHFESIESTTAIIEDIKAVLAEMESNVRQAIEAGGSQDIAGNPTQADTAGHQQELQQLLEELEEVNRDIGEHQAGLQENMKEIRTSIKTAGDFIQSDLPGAEERIQRAADFVRNDLPAAEENIHLAADFVRTKLPRVEGVIGKAADLARNDLPGFALKVRSAADSLRRFGNSVDLNELIQFLKHDPEAESNFLADPVLLKTKRIFPIPNYGSAMNPFYTMLALWVGATLLVASLRVDVENSEGTYRSYQLYFGRLLTFLTIGFFQAIVVSLGDLYIIHTYVAEKLWFVVSCVFIGIVFITMIYTLCSVLGNIGKGVAIILLVLQISSSGSTFPVTLTSSFFQAINPFMPFTYGVSLLRETVGGMVKEVVQKDVLALFIFAAASFLIALLLKKPLSNWISKTAEKAKATKIIP